MITRDSLIDWADTVCRDETRLDLDTIRELQDAHNVNVCDECDDWLDGDNVSESHVTIIDEIEFWERYGD